MMPSAENNGPIRALQTMLRTIAGVHWSIPYLVPDGVFGEDTLEAVMTFQRLFGLPVTGSVDQRTWDSVYQEFSAVSRQLSPPRGAYLFPYAQERIRPGQESPLLIPIQGMLGALSNYIEGIEYEKADGTLGAKTEGSLRMLQKCGGLPETGELNAQTWDVLSRLYELFVACSPRCEIRDSHS